MKPEAAFDYAQGLFVELSSRAFERQSTLQAERMQVTSRPNSKPDRLPCLLDFLAEFEIAGRVALKRKGLASRKVLFDAYYCGGAELHSVRAMLGIGELTFAQWCDDVRHIVGIEVLKRGLIPSRPYFNELLSDAGVHRCTVVYVNRRGKAVPPTPAHRQAS